jgi:hypothetical protein
MAISDIVAASISVADSAPKAVAFDTPLIVAKAPYVGARLYGTTPSGLADMVTDGFPTYSRAYQLMTRIAGQSGGAARAYIYGRTTQHTIALDFTVDIAKTAVGQVLSFTLGYQGAISTISVTVVTNTVNAILDLIETAINASTAGLAGLTVTPDNATATKLTITTDTTGEFAQFDLGGAQWASLEDVGTDGSLAAQLAAGKTAAEAVDGGTAYGLLIDSYAETEINLAATFAEANEMLFLGQSPDQEILESGQTDDIATDLKNASFTRSAVCFSRNMTSDWAAGLLGRQLGQAPGSSSWHMRQITGATADVLTGTHFAAARAKRALLFTTDRGVAHTWDGFAASGRFFDITHGVDFLKADIQTRVYQSMLNQEKIGFNPAGLAITEAAIRGALGNAETELGLVEPGWTVDMPNLTGYSSVDKAARLLRTVRFTAVLTGAVHKITVAGTLTLG